jgi:hypothetical protein
LLSLVLRNLPSEAIHPNAMNAAKAARCAQVQDRYDEMHDSLFNDLEVIRFGGHLPRGGYDVRNVRDPKPTAPSAVHR